VTVGRQVKDEVAGVHLNLSQRVDCENATDYRSRISCLNLTSLFVFFLFLLCRLTSGAFTIDYSTPTLMIHISVLRISSMYRHWSLIIIYQIKRSYFRFYEMRSKAGK
jgi:hypothetical protein